MKYGRMSTKELIGEGFYKENGLKIGLWEELSINCSCIYQTIEKGLYQDGKKQGRWSINKKTGYVQRMLQKIGGEQYKIKD
ncbi:unnamed protein product [Paramecium sonneborni]|uniref:Uncharacterized protein n=1 Tax=Paramecium sonneborni TaxID=65129 RepID=A0A8S1N4X7_9CILI|nr:unnamed protein product [Paramecium sonneborni]